MLAHLRMVKGRKVPHDEFRRLEALLQALGVQTQALGDDMSVAFRLHMHKHINNICVCYMIPWLCVIFWFCVGFRYCCVVCMVLHV